MMKSTKRIILTTVAATVMTVSLAAPAIANEAQDHGNDSSNGTSALKDQGIKSCDLTPSGCESSTDDPVVDPGHNPVKIKA